MPVMETLIRELRSALDSGEVTMSGLARQAGCTRQHLYGVLDGNHKLSLEKAEKLAKAVGCELRFHGPRKKVSA